MATRRPVASDLGLGSLLRTGSTGMARPAWSTCAADRLRCVVRAFDALGPCCVCRGGAPVGSVSSAVQREKGFALQPPDLDQGRRGSSTPPYRSCQWRFTF